MNQSATLAAAATGNHAEVCAAPGNWSVTHKPAAATKATITQPAVAGKRHVCTGILISFAAGATPQTPIGWSLIDGASGGSALLAGGAVSAPANQSAAVPSPGLSLPGSVNTAMTLEFDAAGVAASLEAVTLMGYDISD